MHRFHLIIPSIIALLMLAGSGCTKTANGLPGATGPAGQAGANGTGVEPNFITGYIDLFDQYGNPYPPSGGVTLLLVTGNSLLTENTDSTGSFRLGPVPPGNYDIKATKPGFDSLEIFFQNSGGDEPKFLGGTAMYQSSTTKITGQTVAIQTGTLVLTTSFSGPPESQLTQRGFNYYFSHTSNVTSKNYTYSFGEYSVNNSNTMQLQFLLSNLSSSSPTFISGDSVYVKTIISHPYTITSYYYDYATDQSFTYPYLGDSTVASFKMP